MRANNKKKALFLKLNIKLKVTHVVVRPQLQAAGADAENAGEKLVGRKELWEAKVLG